MSLFTKEFAELFSYYATPNSKSIVERDFNIMIRNMDNFIEEHYNEKSNKGYYRDND